MNSFRSVINFDNIKTNEDILALNINYIKKNIIDTTLNTTPVIENKVEKQINIPKNTYNLKNAHLAIYSICKKK